MFLGHVVLGCTDLILLSVDVGHTHQLHRCVLVEVSRIENHLLNVACHAGDLGCLLSLLSAVRGHDLSPLQ